MTHAGFWVDGAVRKPEQRHGNTQGLVFLKWKDHSDIGTALSTSKFTNWSNAYWLDTTPRESLTPEELWSLVKVVWPDAKCIKNYSGEWRVDYDSESGDNETKIDWGNLTQYPPPAEPQWIRITRGNVGQYLFRLCRFQDSDGKFHDGHVVGWDITDECCLVDSDYSEIEPVLQWEVVEVQNAATP